MGYSLLVVNILIIDEHNDGTCHFKDYAKGSFDDEHVGSSVLILIIIVIDEHNVDEMFR